MKIVYCINQIDQIGGTERVIIAKANALSELPDNKIYIIVAFSKKKNASITVNKKVNIINLDVHYYDDYGFHGIKALRFFYKKRKEHRSRLEKALNDISPNIVISTGGAEKTFLPLLNVSSKPIFIREMHFHKYYRRIMATSFFEKVVAMTGEFIEYNLHINKYDQIVVLTQEDLTNNWNNKSKIRMIPNPIFHDSKEKSSLNNKIVISAGRLVESKNFSSLISAWRKIKSVFPDWKLEIYGDGPFRNELLDEIKKKKLLGHVNLCGFTNNIHEKMLKSSIFVFTSRCEGFGLVLVEAMNHGLPVISYDCPCGPKEIITQGKDGYLVHLNDEDTLSKRLIEIMANDTKRKEMGNNAILKSRNYSMSIIIKMWMSLFDELLRNNKSTTID